MNCPICDAHMITANNTAIIMQCSECGHYEERPGMIRIPAKRQQPFVRRNRINVLSLVPAQ